MLFSLMTISHKQSYKQWNNTGSLVSNPTIMNYVVQPNINEKLYNSKSAWAAQYNKPWYEI